MTSPTPDLAELRRLLDDMRALATREGIYNGNRAVLDIIGSVEPLLDAAAERDALADELSDLREYVATIDQRRDELAAERDALAAFAQGLQVATDSLRAECDALADKVAECEALMVELQPDPVLVGDSWIPFRDLAEVCGNFMRLSAEHAREAKALAAKVERVRRECLIGKGYAGWAAMSRAVLAILDEEPQP